MARSPQIRMSRLAMFGRAMLVLLTLLLFTLSPLRAQQPAEPPAPGPAASANGGSSASSSPSEEVSSRDTPPTFKVRVNLVLVRVVVRDAQGNAVPNLKKEDFQLFDNRKPQVISSFTAEMPESHTVTPTTEAAATPDSSVVVSPVPAQPAGLPQRFVAMVFDDTSMRMEDATAVRDAASRLFGSLAPSDRVALYSTSGQVNRDFTADREALQQTLLGVIPRPVAGPFGGVHSCPDVNSPGRSDCEFSRSTGFGRGHRRRGAVRVQRRRTTAAGGTKSGGDNGDRSSQPR